MGTPAGYPFFFWAIEIAPGMPTRTEGECRDRLAEH
jgi:hypothetical protein